MALVSTAEADDALLTVRRERRMTRTHLVLWAVILATTVADILLTMVGLAAGYREGNAVVAALLAEFGLVGLWLVKFGAMVWLVCGWLLLDDRNAAVFLALFGAVTGAAVVSNALLLFA
ncbi:DUF5658 family protein [Haloarcula sp. S1CR25-12]|uniref:DUF5658 family protein n=1 Tax=Haloarcula saliterrae TaxID=2950534 RepID=A0ABU2FB20_9EURY|nr:DUF5658 family protein [Haloarcula sp. S1CR25-12]MDS0259113.1 DUF5658 family protein [Haloarcula sp. S1CR25-12]